MAVTLGGGPFGNSAGAGSVDSDLSGTGAAGQVAIWSAALTLGGSAGLTYDTGTLALSGTGPWALTPSTDIVPVTVRASAGAGTAHIFQWQKSDSSALGHITHGGTLVPPALTCLGVSTLGPPATDITPLTLRASPGGGTAPVAQWQASDNTPLGHIAHDGAITAPSVTDSAITATHVVYGGAAGLLSGNAGLTFTVGTGTVSATNVTAAANLTGLAILGSRTKIISDGNPVAFATFTIADGAVASGEILYSVKSVKTTALQVLVGRVRFAATREGSTYTVSIAEVGTQTLAANAGTLTGNISIAATAGVVTFTATFDTSQSAPDFVTLFYRFESPDALVVTGL